MRCRYRRRTAGPVTRGSTRRDRHSLGHRSRWAYVLRPCDRPPHPAPRLRRSRRPFHGAGWMHETGRLGRNDDYIPIIYTRPAERDPPCRRNRRITAEPVIGPRFRGPVGLIRPTPPHAPYASLLSVRPQWTPLGDGPSC